MQKILVVDDDRDILYVMRLLLTKNGFHVDITSKGEDTIRKAKEIHPDLIILDVRLGGIDGRDICRKLKSGTETRDIPIIMFSANTNRKEVMSKCNADDFVGKPFEINNMIERINMQLSLN